jgi:hypothetical protein
MQVLVKLVHWLTKTSYANLILEVGFMHHGKEYCENKLNAQHQCSSSFQWVALVLRPAGSAITFSLAITCCQQNPLQASNVLAYCYDRSS